MKSPWATPNDPRIAEAAIDTTLPPRYRKRCVWCGQPCNGRTCAQHQDIEKAHKRREKTCE